MKLNLGCGEKKIQGYVNVDVRKEVSPDVVADLSQLPWPFKDESAEEILMLDFLEHFPYRQTEPLLQEAWRVLKTGGALEIQIPDLRHCSRAAAGEVPFMCNRCGWEFNDEESVQHGKCKKCDQWWEDIALAATHRLFGGQDYPGNWHFAGFTKELLMTLLSRNGFPTMTEIALNENGETFWQNWNLKIRAVKGELDW